MGSIFDWNLFIYKRKHVCLHSFQFFISNAESIHLFLAFAFVCFFFPSFSYFDGKNNFLPYYLIFLHSLRKNKVFILFSPVIYVFSSLENKYNIPLPIKNWTHFIIRHLRGLIADNFAKEHLVHINKSVPENIRHCLL